MEFFEEIKNTRLDKDDLQQLLTIERLPQLCQSISAIIADQTDSGVIYCIWGEHEINREILKHGVRFSLPGCPNAMAWTITSKEQSDGKSIIIHCTTDTKESDEDFIESIREFVDDWRAGIIKT
ncbi:MAG: hypothetical protein OEZ38_14675 [Gammaproteobacteria bacterium]|nr:hypothetical protein [Gammaproteobacteria bacterium]